FGAKVAWTSAAPKVLSTQNLSSNPNSLTEPNPTLVASATGTVTLAAKPQVLIYNITGPYLDVEIGLKAQLVPTAVAPNPWFTLTLQLDVNAGWKIDLLVWHQQLQATLAHRSW